MQLTGPLLKNVLVFTLFCAIGATAQEVELSSPDSGLKFKGEIIKFEDRQYTIRTSLGELVVSADEMDCIGEACPVLKAPAAEFRISGAKTPGESLLPQLFNSYAAQSDVTLQIGNHPEEGRLLALIDGEGDPLANVQLVSSSSSTGLVDLLQGDTQMALSTRPPRPNEADAFQKSGLGEIQGRGQEFILGLESVLIVTAPQNPIQSISDKTAAQIFSGAITNWAELGGADLPIQVYIRDIESDTGDAFNSLLMAPQSQQMRDDATVVSDDARLAARVATDPAGIGFVRFGRSNQAKALAISGECGMRVAPSTFSIKAEEYPLTRRLSAYVAGQTPDQMSGFLEYLATDDAQIAVGAAGFITQDILDHPLSNHAQRLASAIMGDPTPEALPRLKEMVRAMADSTQLSLSFRFVPGTNKMDARSFQDLERLASLLATDEYAQKTVTLASFTEAAANAAQNQPLSVQRGQIVLNSLLEIDPDLENNVNLSTVGFGDISPLTCRGTVTGQHTNSRVEVWVKDPIN